MLSLGMKLQINRKRYYGEIIVKIKDEILEEWSETSSVLSMDESRYIYVELVHSIFPLPI